MNPFGSEFWYRLAEMAKIVAELDAHLPEMMAAVRRIHRSPSGSNNGFWAKITGNSLADTSKPIWKYSWSEMEVLNAVGTDADFGVKSGGQTGSNNAINTLEHGNTTSLAYGTPAAGTSTFYLTTAPFTASDFRAVPTGAVVWMTQVTRPTSGTARFQFTAPNIIAPECEA